MKQVPQRPGTIGRGIGGRQKLIDAALELASTTRSLASLGLREVTRCAGLAPNSFYRHFKDFDDLGLAAVEMLGGELRRGLRERRRRPSQSRKATGLLDSSNRLNPAAREMIRSTVGLVLDFVDEHPTAYIVGIRELHGSSPTMRKAVNHLLDAFAADMAEDVRALVDIPGLGTEALNEISRQMIRQMTFFSMDYLEQPGRRDAIRDEAERFIVRMFAGEMAMAEAKKPARKVAKRG
ncbi:MAG TPA: hypothetical protein VLI06_16485 [Solimonas sp.]|nr:hypothetical protein [Solimonas sp.]